MPGPTILDRICLQLTQIVGRADEADATHLIETMHEFKTDRPTSYRNLMLVPGFRKLWEAIDEGCGIAMDEVKCMRFIRQIAERKSA